MLPHLVKFSFYVYLYINRKKQKKKTEITENCMYSVVYICAILSYRTA